MSARLEELRAKFQENPRRYFAPFANELRKAGDPSQAISICRTHLAGQPGHVSGHIVLAQALHEAGEWAEAGEVFNAALELDPENLIALRSMGDMAHASGDFDKARSWYERLLDADPRNQEVGGLLAGLPRPGTAAVAPDPADAETPGTDTLPDDAWTAPAPTGGLTDQRVEPFPSKPEGSSPPGPAAWTAAGISPDQTLPETPIDPTAPAEGDVSVSARDSFPAAWSSHPATFEAIEAAGDPASHGVVDVTAETGSVPPRDGQVAGQVHGMPDSPGTLEAEDSDTTGPSSSTDPMAASDPAAAPEPEWTLPAESLRRESDQPSGDWESSLTEYGNGAVSSESGEWLDHGADWSLELPAEEPAAASAPSSEDPDWSSADSNELELSSDLPELSRMPDWMSNLDETEANSSPAGEHGGPDASETDDVSDYQWSSGLEESAVADQDGEPADSSDWQAGPRHSGFGHDDPDASSTPAEPVSATEGKDFPELADHAEWGAVTEAGVPMEVSGAQGDAERGGEHDAAPVADSSDESWANPEAQVTGEDTMTEALLSSVGFESLQPPIDVPRDDVPLAEAATADESIAGMGLLPDMETAGSVESVASGESPDGAVADDEAENRALYAENGFEGELDSPGWRLSPSAVYSDPAAAPDDWFAEVNSATDSLVEDVPAEPEPVSAQAGQPDPAGDAEADWFSDAGSLEGPVSGNDEFFMAPDLAVVSSAEGPPPVAAAPGNADAGEAPYPVDVEAFEPRTVQDQNVLEPVQVQPVVSDQAGEDFQEPSAVAGSEVQDRTPVRPVEGTFPGVGTEAAPSTGPVSAAPFLTATLAELYLKQGFRGEALAIYRQLSERDPENASLRERILALSSETATSPDAGGSAASRAGQRSIGAFFSHIARRAPSAAAAQARLARTAAEARGETAAGSAPVDNTEPPFATAASALANLFSASQPGSSDQEAARTLARAVTEGTHRPSREADRELSLDHLFRDVPRSTSGASLDDFYAPPGGPTGEATQPDGSVGAPEEGEADIRQFTAWLEGLRKK